MKEWRSCSTKLASLFEGGSLPLTAEGLTPESGLQWKVREVSIQFRLERRPTNFRSEFVCHLSHTRIGGGGVLGVFDSGVAPDFHVELVRFSLAVFSRNFFASERMSEPCHCHIADRPLHFKRQEICTNVPRLKTFCIFRQTSKGSRPMHSGLEDESKLDSKWREVCTGYLESQSLHFASFRHSFPVGVFLRVLQVEDAQFSP